MDFSAGLLAPVFDLPSRIFFSSVYIIIVFERYLFILISNITHQCFKIEPLVVSVVLILWIRMTTAGLVQGRSLMLLFNLKGRIAVAEEIPVPVTTSFGDCTDY